MCVCVCVCVYAYQVPQGYEGGAIYEDEKELPPSVSLKLGCLADGIQDSTFPMRERLARVQGERERGR